MNVYEKMAVAGELVSHQVRYEGVAPQRKVIAEFTYANGLVVSYSGGKSFEVVTEPRKS